MIKNIIVFYYLLLNIICWPQLYCNSLSLQVSNTERFYSWSNVSLLNLFSDMEKQHGLNPDNTIYIFALHVVFLMSFNTSWTKLWNKFNIYIFCFSWCKVCEYKCVLKNINLNRRKLTSVKKSPVELFSAKCHPEPPNPMIEESHFQSSWLARLAVVRSRVGSARLCSARECKS